MLCGSVVPLTLLVLVLLNPALCDGRDASFLLVTSSSVDFNTTDVIDSVQLAVDEVLKESLLRSLRYYVMEAECNRTNARGVLKSQLMDGQSSLVAAVVGLGCTDSTLAVADLTDIQLPPIVSYASLRRWDNPMNYSSVVRIVPSYSQLAQALVKLVSHFNWKRVGFITEEIAMSLKDFRAEFSSAGIAVDVQVIEKNSNNILIGDNRIIILDTKLSTAKLILCKAFQGRKYYPGFIWIVIDNFVSSRWWEDQIDIELACNDKQLEDMLNYSLISGIHPPANNESFLRFAPYACDAVRAVALALNRSATLGQAFNISSISDVSFEGQSGLVEFIDHERANTLLYINQMRHVRKNLMESDIGTYSYISRKLNITVSTSDLWPLGVPSDGVPVTVIVPLYSGLFYLSVILTTIGLLWTIACFIFLVIYRKAKIIRLTSPKLHCLMLMGSFIAYGSLVLYTLQITDSLMLEVICTVRLALFTVFGYNICLAVATVKLWRIYYIFVNPKPNKKVPKDGHLMLAILMITAVDFTVLFIIITLEAIFTSPELQRSEFYETSTNQTTGEVKEYYLLICNRGSYFRLIQSWTFIHKLIVHSASLYFSFRTRKIKISVLNEYKSSSAIAYSTIVFVFLTAVLLFPLAGYPNFYVFCYTLLLFTMVSLFVSLTFIPKMIALCKDPRGEKIFQQDRVEAAPPREQGTENFS